MSTGERHLNTNFILLRRETSGGYSTRGPVAQPMSLKEVRDEIVRPPAHARGAVWTERHAVVRIRKVFGHHPPVDAAVSDCLQQSTRDVRLARGKHARLQLTKRTQSWFSTRI